MERRLVGISGSMFAGKTTEFLRRAERREIAGQNVLLIKPSTDTRWDAQHWIKSHTGARHKAIVIPSDNPEVILEIIKNSEKRFDMVGIEEIQFFNRKIVDVVEEIIDYGNGTEVVFAGLPLDFKGDVFGQMGVLLAKADNITRLSAVCTHKSNGCICGDEATRTQRFVNKQPAHIDDPVVMIGAREKYAPRCRTHHIVNRDPR